MKKEQRTLYIKNMVCDRCIKVVKEELEKLGFEINKIVLGEVKAYGEFGKDNLVKIKNVLEENGFELIEDKRGKIIEKIKSEIINLIFRNDSIPDNIRLSKYLEENLNHDYHYLSTLFSSVENVTIEQFFILQKIERAKEFIKYGELTLGEIAFKLGYSSVQHLSAQFKKVTGFTASQFKNQTTQLRKPIDKVK